MPDFDGLIYTREAIARELELIQLHSTDGSAVEAHCACIQEKHLLAIEGLAGEGVTLAKDEKESKFYVELTLWASRTKKYIIERVHKWKAEEEKAYYASLAITARNLRSNIQNDDFSFVEKCGCVGCPPCSNVFVV